MNILSIILCFFNNEHSFHNQGWRASFFSSILSKKRTQRAPYVECRTLDRHNTTLAARTKKTSKGKKRKREKERGGGGGRGEGGGAERGKKECVDIHIYLQRNDVKEGGLA